MTTITIFTCSKKSKMLKIEVNYTFDAKKNTVITSFKLIPNFYPRMKNAYKNVLSVGQIIKSFFFLISFSYSVLNKKANISILLVLML